MALPLRSGYLFNYRPIWWVAVLLMGTVALLPLIIITVINYRAGPGWGFPSPTT